MKKLEIIITSIRPSKIIHLAAISESESIMKNSFDTIYTNGVVACKICEIIHQHQLFKTKFFNTCSSEMFKGHKQYTIQDDDRNFDPTYPYSYGKILSYYIIEFYRKKYGYIFFNGILFPTESQNRKEGFLMRKIKDHIISWKMNKNKLKLGNLYSYRNMLHVQDVADAISIILDQDVGDNYVISGDQSYLLLDIVIKYYEKNGIYLENDGLILLDKYTKEILVEFEGKNGTEININGNSNKLKKLGWKPKFNLDELLKSL